MTAESPYRADVLSLALDHYQPTNAGDLAADFDEDPVAWLLILRDSRDGEVMGWLRDVCRTEDDDAELNGDGPAWEAVVWVDLRTGLVHQAYSSLQARVVFGIPEDAPEPLPIDVNGERQHEPAPVDGRELLGSLAKIAGNGSAADQCAALYELLGRYGVVVP